MSDESHKAPETAKTLNYAIDQVYRPKIGNLIIMLICLPFFIGFVILSFFVEPTSLMLFILLMWGFMISLIIWQLLDYLLSSLSISNGMVSQRGVLRRKVLILSDITCATWIVRLVSGKIELKSPSVNLIIDFDKYKGEQQLIDFFRSAIPEQAQEDWPLFYDTIALPMQKEESRLLPFIKLGGFSYFLRVMLVIMGFIACILAYRLSEGSIWWWVVCLVFCVLSVVKKFIKGLRKRSPPNPPTRPVQ